MARKPKPPQDDSKRSKRFIKIGRRVGVKETEGFFERELMKGAHPNAPNDLEESKRFPETAREVGADESPEAFARAFKRVVKAKKALPKRRDREK